jgi:predicted membrane protein
LERDHDVFSEGGYVPDRGSARACFISCDSWNIGGNVLAYLPFLFALVSFSTYVGTIRKLGAGLLLIEVVCIDTFYGVVFAPQKIGWGAALAFGGSVIAFGLIVLFDNWLWPDRSEAILMESLGASVARARSRSLEASNFF